jgi:hypothetical protein
VLKTQRAFSHQSLWLFIAFMMFILNASQENTLSVAKQGKHSKRKSGAENLFFHVVAFLLIKCDALMYKAREKSSIAI